MISYKLAKQLKEAGFPYKEDKSGMSKLCLCTKDVCETPFGREFRFDGELYSEPTLYELINACGSSENMELTLRIYGNGATAIKGSGAGHGKTPEEAVAKLFIALYERKNSKKDTTTVQARPARQARP